MGHGARNLAIQALHICVVSLAESVRIMELVYPIPMRFTDSGKPLWARFSATGGTDMCKESMAKFVTRVRVYAVGCYTYYSGFPRRTLSGNLVHKATLPCLRHKQ